VSVRSIPQSANAKADEIKFGDFRVADVDGVYTK
jgi:hypothetical protein